MGNESMRRTAGFYLKGGVIQHDSPGLQEGSENSIHALVLASTELRQTLKSATCPDDRIRLHTRLDKLERQLLQQLVCHMAQQKNKTK